MQNDVSQVSTVLGVLGFVLWYIISAIASSRARSVQRWAGAVHAAIQIARGSKQPDWLLHLESCFETAYEKTHGKKANKAIVARGVADMANIISNHLLSHHQSEVAGDFHAVLEKHFGLDTSSAPPPSVSKPPLRRFSTMMPGAPSIILAMAFCSSICVAQDEPKPIAATVEKVAFAPNGSSKNGYGDCDCTRTVVDAIEHAKRTIIVQAYNFTSEPIAAAFIAAKKRGVDVKIVCDQSVPTERGSKGAECLEAGISVVIDKKHHIAHNKVIVLDGETVITGSFNWTDSAENSNAENLLVLKSPELAAIYAANWEVHFKHAEKFPKD